MTHIACESKLCLVVRSSIHLCKETGYQSGIVIYYARAAPQHLVQESNVGTEEGNTLFSFSKTNLSGMVMTFEREKIEIHIPFPWYLSEFVKCGGPWSIILVGSSV